MAVSPETPAVVAGRAEAGIVAAVCATGTAGPLITAVPACPRKKTGFLLLPAGGISGKKGIIMCKDMQEKTFEYLQPNVFGTK